MGRTTGTAISIMSLLTTLVASYVLKSSGGSRRILLATRRHNSHHRIMLWMCLFAQRAIRTESSQIEFTQDLSNMPVSAARTVLAEPSRVPKTLLSLGSWIDVQILAFRIAALPVLGEEPAFGHFFEVVFVQKFTRITLFTETSQPVLADDGLFVFSMFVDAVCPVRAHSAQKIFTSLG